LRAATDTEIEVTRQEGADFSVATVVKQRELETGGAFAFRLEKVELGTNRRGKPVTSCIVKSVDDNSISIKATRPLSPKEIRALDVLKNVFVEHSIPAPAGHNLPMSGSSKLKHSAPSLGSLELPRVTYQGRSESNGRGFAMVLITKELSGCMGNGFG